MPNITNGEFLRELARAAPPGSRLWVTAFEQDPARGSWMGQPYDNTLPVDEWSDRNTYFSVAAIKDVTNGRKRANVAALLALVVDDANREDLLASPSWVFETSPGKVQIGILLDPDDSDIRDLALVDALIRTMVARGVLQADASGNNACRYVRLPVGTNTKPRPGGPSPHVVLEWNPTVRMTLEDAAQTFGISLDEVKAALRRVDTGTTIAALTGAGDTAQPYVLPQDQADKMKAWMEAIISGRSYHAPLVEFAGSLLATGMHPGAATNFMRSLMEAAAPTEAARTERWRLRYDDIARSVSTAEAKGYYRAGTPHEGGLLLEPDGKPVFEGEEEFFSRLGPAKWTVRDTLEANAVSCIWGPSGSGKSFIAIDLAYCVASGRPWHGKATDPDGRVAIYVAGEGRAGVVRRAAAWKLHNNFKLTDRHPFEMSVRTINIDGSSGEWLLEHIRKIASKYPGRELGILIIDTLARALGGDQDENSAKDVSAFLRVMDLILVEFPGLHICIIHHSGHNKDHARGSTALKAGVDQEYKVGQAAEYITLENVKMKDGRPPAPHDFKLLDVEICEDADGEVTKSAVLISEKNPLLDEVASVKTEDGTRVRVTGEMIFRLIELGVLPSATKMADHFKAPLGKDGKRDRNPFTRMLQKLAQAGLIEPAQINAKGAAVGYKPSKSALRWCDFLNMDRQLEGRADRIDGESPTAGDDDE